jgi:hypothetical protein
MGVWVGGVIVNDGSDKTEWPEAWYAGYVRNSVGWDSEGTTREGVCVWLVMVIVFVNHVRKGCERP